MADNKTAFLNSSNYQALRNDIAHGERVVHHALDNYGMDMSKGLKEALENLERAYKEVLKEV